MSLLSYDPRFSANTEMSGEAIQIFGGNIMCLSILVVFLMCDNWFIAEGSDINV
jgi:hypothetical protein